MQIVHMQPLESSLYASDCLVQPLRKDFLSSCTRWSLAESDDTRGRNDVHSFHCTYRHVSLCSSQLLSVLSFTSSMARVIFIFKILNFSKKLCLQWA